MNINSKYFCLLPNIYVLFSDKKNNKKLYAKEIHDSIVSHDHENKAMIN